MKNIKSKQNKLQVFMLMAAFAIFSFVSCSKDDDPAEDPIATFQYEINEDNPLEVKFMNFSLNAETYFWDFGDENSSTVENPTHEYEVYGTYEVTLTATNADGVSSSFSETIELQDPDEALALIAGETSKTWRLYREGAVLGVGPDKEGARTWWALENDGSRPCVFYHEFTFHRNGDFVFDDKGVFWGEVAIFAGTDVNETCFEAIPSNMFNSDGVDVSAFLGGTHAFEFDSGTNMITLNGNGAWMGMPQLGTTGESIVPVDTKSFKIESIEQHEGYDLMIIAYSYADLYWDFTYAHYHDPSLEPDVVDEQDEDPPLETITPTELGHTFESDDSFDYLGAIMGASIINTGADDPEDADATNVGEFIRTDAQYQEAILRVYPDPKNILFDNFTTVSVDVYLPSSNDYDPLTKKVIIGFGNMHDDGGNWWQNLIQHESDELALDEWVTVTFELDSPTYSGEEDGQTVYDRDNLDMVFIQIGGTDHTSEGVFYIRNLIFE